MREWLLEKTCNYSFSFLSILCILFRFSAMIGYLFICRLSLAFSAHILRRWVVSPFITLHKYLLFVLLFINTIIYLDLNNN